MINRLIVCGAWVAMGLLSNMTPARADVMNLDLTNVDPVFHAQFRAAEKFWENRLIGFSGALPGVVKSQLQKVRIVCNVEMIDGLGGILGQAGVTRTISYTRTSYNPLRGSQTIVIAQESVLTLDQDDVAAMMGDGSLQWVLRHEIGHALGFGSLWVQNGLLNEGGDYIGSHALSRYRQEANKQFATFVPVQKFGGPGTAGSHWDFNDPFFNQLNTTGRLEFMGPFSVPGAIEFASESTFGAMADLWFAVRGINQGNVAVIGPRGWPKWINNGTGNGGPIFMRAIPEPSSAGLLFLVGAAIAIRRRKGK
ncbi:MAG TPA: PEP-CTERM sorting domain-containing protein [Pirellulaceae bacterium]|nr:PEP-CTERM sorting domain-containing protein [Pirellulaceae bacterium]